MNVNKLMITARTLENKLDRAFALVDIYSLYPNSPLLSEILATIQTIGNEYDQASILKKLVPFLRESLQEKLLTEVHTVERTGALKRLESLKLMKAPDKKFFITQLKDVAIHLQDAERGLVLTEVMSLLEIIDLNNETLIDLAIGLEESECEPLLNNFLDNIKANNGDRLVESIMNIPRHIPEYWLISLLNVVRLLPDEFDRARALQSIAQHLPDPFRKPLILEALQVTRTIEHEGQHIRTLVSFINLLKYPEQEEVLSEALFKTKKLKNKFHRTMNLIDLAMLVPESQKEQLLLEALETLPTIEFDKFLTIAIKKIVPHLPESWLSNVIRIVLNIKQETHLNDALIYIISKLPEALLVEWSDQFISASLSLKNRPNLTKVLKPLLPLLPESSLIELIDLLPNLKNGNQLVNLIEMLDRYIPAYQRKKFVVTALTATKEIFNINERISVFRKISSLVYIDAKLRLLIENEIKKLTNDLKEKESFLEDEFGLRAEENTLDSIDGSMDSTLSEIGLRTQLPSGYRKQKPSKPIADGLQKLDFAQNKGKNDILTQPLFTVYYPELIQTETWHKVLIYIHLPSALTSIKQDYLSRTGDQSLDYDKERVQALNGINRETEITVIPSLENSIFNPAKACCLWLEDWHCIEFRVKADAEAINKQNNKLIKGRIAFFVGPVLIGEITIWINIGKDLEKSINTMPGIETTSTLYQSIFVSYSHKDEEIVTQLEKAYVVLGMDFLRDVHILKSGEKWNASLLKKIEDADIFQLCWSNAAKSSKFVEQEWRHAVAQSRLSFIRPMYWEKPMPKPPVELSSIHFEYYSIAML